MATPLKTENKAEIKLTVGSLEVLGDVSGAGMNTIKRKISSVENAVTSVTEKTNEYWKAVATDNIITPEEKWELKKDWGQIDQTYTAIMETAESKAMQDDPVIIQLKQAHEDLENYLFQKLRLFEDMASNTEIPNVIEFNQKFSIFYDKQYKAQSYLTTGTMGYQDFQFAEGTHDTYPEEEEAWKDSPPPIAYNKYLWFRTRWTNEAGSGNWTYSRIKGDSGPKVYAEYSRDTKSWHEVFSSFQDRYMRLSYDMGETWTEAMKVVGEDGDFTYLGICNDASTLPPAKDGNYFLAGEDFIIESFIIVNGRALMVNGHFLAAKRPVEKGFIYICESGSWQKIEDRNDYRYIIAINDLTEIGAPISPGIKNSMKTSQPMYLGMYTRDPEGQPGDWYVYDGMETTERKTSFVYKYTQNEDGSYSWTELNPTNPDNYSFYMQALPDVMTAKRSELTTDYFAAVFAEAIVSNTAFIKKLSSQIIILQEGEDSSGILKSSNYNDDDPSEGFKIDTEGNADFRGRVNIDGIATLNNVNITGESAFHGTIKSGPLELINDPGEEITTELIAGEKYQPGTVRNINGVKDGVEFDMFTKKIEVYPHMTWVLDSINPIKGHWEITSTDYWSVLLLYKNNEEVGKYEGPKGQTLITMWTAPTDLTYSGSTELTKIFILHDLPTLEPQEPGRVWNDKGTLKIKQ